MIINREPNWDRIILKDIPKTNDLYSIKVPIEFIDFNCSNIEYVVNESKDIVKEKEARIIELKEEIQRRCDKKQEISVKLLEEYNNLI